MQLGLGILILVEIFLIVSTTGLPCADWVPLCSCGAGAPSVFGHEMGPGLLSRLDFGGGQ